MMHMVLMLMLMLKTILLLFVRSVRNTCGVKYWFFYNYLRRLCVRKSFLVLCLCEVSVCEKYSWRKNLGFYDCVKGLCVRMMRLCARTNNKYGSTILALTWDAMTITSSHIISSSRLLLGFLICMLCSRLLCYVFFLCTNKNPNANKLSWVINYMLWGWVYAIWVKYHMLSTWAGVVTACLCGLLCAQRARRTKSRDTKGLQLHS